MLLSHVNVVSSKQDLSMLVYSEKRCHLTIQSVFKLVNAKNIKIQSHKIYIHIVLSHFNRAKMELRLPRGLF